jgi:hypothetical protein
VPVAAGVARTAAARWVAALLAVGLLLAPAVWNGYPLLEYDTGGYLARWYESYLVPSRSTVFGLFLHVGERLAFWPELIAQAVVTVWVIALTLRVFRLAGNPWCASAFVGALSIATTLPWLTSLLLTDIFAGLAVLSFHLIVLHGDHLRKWEKAGLFLLVAISASFHTATMAVLIALAVTDAAICHLRSIPISRLVLGVGAISLGAAMLLAANFAFARQIAWTPGGYGIAFGRMLQDGIVTRYLAEHCPNPHLKLCPYRNELPATADDFLWGDSMFDRLGRFVGLGDEMRQIVLESLIEYPGQQITAAIASTAKQLVMVGSGYGVNDQLPHTYGIIERYIPMQVPAMRAARQQHGELDFTFINRLHVPIALLSMLLATAMIAGAFAVGDFDDLAILTTAVMISILANAFVCGVGSGPHDRYGARIVWLATFVIGIAMARQRQPKPYFI